MRKTVIVLLAIASLLLATAGAGTAGKKAKPRKIEMAYTNHAYGTAGAGVCLQGESCLFFGTPMGKEKFFSVVIEDDLGREVYASVIQDTNEDGSYLVTDDLTVGICGKTTEPIEIEPNKPVSVWVWQGPGADPPCAGTASAGTATATFSVNS